MTAAATQAPALLERLEAAIAGTPARRRRLVNVTDRVTGIPDPVAAVFGSRLATDTWFCWEQADRGFALASLGSAATFRSRGENRFAEIGDDCLELLGRARFELPDRAPAGVGPVFTGGFAFDRNGGGSGTWSSFDPAALTLPELSLCRAEDDVFLALNVIVGPGADPEAALRRIASRVGALGEHALPMLEPTRVGQTSVRGAKPPGDYEQAVAAATERMASTKLEKVIIAREVVVNAPSAHDPAALFGALREVFPSCFTFCCGTPEGAFIGASPELLVRRSGASASTVALAGSTRRSSDPAVDDHLGEQLLRSEKNRREHEIVAGRIVRKLRPHAVWVERAPEPAVIKVANIQHLATPIVSQLAEPRSAVELAGMLHPTPAVGGEPWSLAKEAIADLEGLDRGWYAGPVGWMDATEDGEFCVALRSGVLRDRDAHLFAGCGIVAGSDPEAELAETEIKLGAMLPLLAD